jgi:hypothetical protein
MVTKIFHRMHLKKVILISKLDKKDMIFELISAKTLRSDCFFDANISHFQIFELLGF